MADHTTKPDPPELPIRRNIALLSSALGANSAMLQLTAALREAAGRSPSEPYEVVAALDPVPTPAAYGEAGATWWLAAPEWDGISVDQVRGVIRDRPPAPRQEAAA